FIFSFLSAEIYDVSIPENDTASYNYADFRMWVNDSTDTLRGIYDISVKFVLVRGDFEVGEHEIIWNTSNHSSGSYFVELTSGKNRLVQKLVLLK
ncbi:MAG: hypothetical protein VYD66_01160, partial [Candidatus Neomarinimicrobiota bacterium]|nr:hypothetical protein [Candidatus Neomarinimicrobiota bacterium]